MEQPRQRALFVRALASLGLFATSAIVGFSAAPAQEAAAAGPCDPPVSSVIACENSKPGSPKSEWDVSGAGSSAIQGFATDISVDQGQVVGFKVKTPATDYRIDVYRMGYYGGQGARKVAVVQPSAALPQSQPACLNDSATGLIDCGNWALSASWAVPADAVSGIYLAKLVREDGTAGASHVVFIVRDDDGRSQLLFQTADTTWQAYNDYGGNSLYTGSPAGRAYKVSYNRPFNTRSCCVHDWVFNAEYPMVRWLEANGYDVSYTTGVDSDRLGGEILEHKAFLSVGHDEYWSAGQRANVEAARNAGVHLAFLSANEVFWKTRWEPSIDASRTGHRTLVSYKETHANAKIDPSPEWTGTWRDPRFSPPADGGRPENALTGTIFTVNGERNDSIQVPAGDGKMRLWRGTSVATLSPGQTATMPAGTLGYEWDEELDNGFRPPGLVRLSTATVDGVPLLQDYGSTYSSGTATHHLTLYRHSSGALVFGSGTVQWSWGLDANHDRAGTPTDVRMQQATVNLLADMGAQPATMQSGLTAATASTDATAPASTITSPAAGSEVASGTTTTITGTATDSGGGVVGGVEISVDGGTTWRPATGRESWSYTWTPTTVGSVTIKSRATDDSGNIESGSAGVSVNVVGPTCPCTIWPSSATPALASTTDPNAVELGVKFRTDVAGSITGIRFYKGSNNTGTHVGSLWSVTGAKLASATFTNETASGWQQVSFSTPVAVNANTTYVASYHAPVGRYAIDEAYFASKGVDSPPLRALASGVDGANGVYLYGPGGFPSNSYNASNYWVDVVFTTGSTTDTTPPTVTGHSPAANQTGVAVGTNATATFSEDVQSDSITFSLTGPIGAVTGVKSYSAATRTVTFDPDSDLAASTTYTASVSGAKDANGNTMAPLSWSFTTAGGTTGPTCPCTIWPSSAAPKLVSQNDSRSVEVGVKFRTDVAGSVTGIRFYKGSNNTGTHVGSLWSATGARLASATFTNETASGWQQVSFSTPVAVSANTTYVASYHAPVGRYSYDQSYFASAGVSNPPLHALANGVDGGNGVYRYSSTSVFPDRSHKASNYWVDVVFTTTAT